MIGTGRPLRFLLLVVGGWMLMRTVQLWPEAEAVVEALRDSPIGGLFEPAAAAAVPRAPIGESTTASPGTIERPGTSAPAIAPAASRSPPLPPADPQRAALALAGLLELSPPRLLALASGAPTPAQPLTPPAVNGRWSASAWAVIRRGGGEVGPAGGIGGSQAGARIAWRPFATNEDVAVFGRASTPLATRGADAAVGIEWRPFRAVPVRAVIEQRVALEPGGSRGTAIGVVGGVNAVPIAVGFTLDGYGQAGIIGLRRRIGFADGAIAATRPVATAGDAEIGIGAGAWGAVQPGVGRLDIGPRLQVLAPVAGTRVRIGLEWRERIAGNASPNSGPALSIGADF